MWAVTLGDNQRQRKRPARIVAEVMILLRKAVTENPELPINPIILLCSRAKNKAEVKKKKKNHKKYPAVKSVYCKTQDIKIIIKLQENLEAQALTQQ